MMDQRDRMTSPGARSALRFATLAFALALAPLSAQAEDQPQHPTLAAIQAAFKRCQQPGPGELPDGPCMEQTTKTLDALLNRVYRGIVAGLKQSDKQDHPGDANTLERLTASQHAWETYREAACDDTGPDKAGSIVEYNMWAYCEFTMRVDRMNLLFDLYSMRFPEIAGKR